jgi:predicted amidohydrolase
VKVVALQFNVAWEDKHANFARVRALLTAAAPEPGSLVALPEMFATGFSMNAATIAEAQGGETGQFLATTARAFGITLVGGAAIRESDGSYRNQALVYSPSGEFLGAYSKLRLFTPGQEERHYTAGDQPMVFPWGETKVAPFICYDVRFPELFRAATRAGQPELFVVIANFPAKRIAHWVRLLQARAIENQAWVMGVNRIGQDSFYSYNGRSIIVDPQGEIVADAGETEGTIQATLDLETLRKYRTGLPFLKDLRPIG